MNGVLSTVVLPAVMIVIVFTAILFSTLTPKANRPVILVFGPDAVSRDALFHVAALDGRLLAIDTAQNQVLAVFSDVPSWSAMRRHGVIMAFDANGAAACGFTRATRS